MPRLSSPTLLPRASGAPAPCAWEPALTQLRALPRPDLDRLVLRWLRALGLHAPRVMARESGPACYRAFLGDHPLCVPVEVRLYQRKSRLQVHHIESFVGSLHGQKVGIGLLISTGGFTPDARVAAQSCRTPILRLSSGEEWAAELAALHVGLRRRSLWRWLLELPIVIKRRSDRTGRRAL